MSDWGGRVALGIVMNKYRNEEVRGNERSIHLSFRRTRRPEADVQVVRTLERRRSSKRIHNIGLLDATLFQAFI